MARSVIEIIKKAGGRKAVAESIGLHPQTVYYWREKGIPWKYWPNMVRLLPGLTVSELFRANCEAVGLLTQSNGGQIAKTNQRRQHNHPKRSQPRRGQGRSR